MQSEKKFYHKPFHSAIPLKTKNESVQRCKPSVLKLWVLRSYSRCSKILPSISRQTAMAARHSLQHALVNRINPCQSCLKFCHKVFDSPRRDCVNVPLLVLPQETFHWNEIRRQRRICSRSSTSNPPTWICRLSKGRTSSPQEDGDLS